MNHSNFNFYDAFDFDDNTPLFAFQVATAVVAEEESNNQRRRTGYCGSILGHNIVNRNRKEGELRLYDTTKRLMSSPRCKSVEVINNSARPGSNHMEVNCINYK